ncbi:MAG TPA: helix-turn-helix domain-containing protein, partial [Vicinamibacterales bacterium]
LERLFDSALGQSPVHYYRNLRLDRAQHLLRETSLSVVQVAVATGFNSVSSLSLAYRDCFGCSPSSDRQQRSN